MFGRDSETHKASPAYQDKEERRLIILSSMENLLKINEVERNEKHNTLKFYAVFLGGGLTLVFGMTKFSAGITSALLEIIALTVIIAINFLAIKKLIAVRGASSNIYREYGKRQRYLLNHHSSDIVKGSDSDKELDDAFQKYIDDQIHEDFLPKHSADTYEIYGFYYLNVLFSTIFIVPIFVIAKYVGCFDEKIKIIDQFITGKVSCTCIAFILISQLLISLVVWWFGKYILDNISKSPNLSTKTNKMQAFTK